MLKHVGTRAERAAHLVVLSDLLRKGFRVGSQCQGKEMRFQGHGP